jgi:hypothetical protein
MMVGHIRFTMHMVKGELNHEFTLERTVPLCNMTVGLPPPCTVYRTQAEFEDYEDRSVSSMKKDWNP